MLGRYMALKPGRGDASGLGPVWRSLWRMGDCRCARDDSRGVMEWGEPKTERPAPYFPSRLFVIQMPEEAFPKRLSISSTYWTPRAVMALPFCVSCA